MPSWPAQLPLYPLLDSFNYVEAPSVVSFAPDCGPALTYRDASVNIARAHVAYVLREDEHRLFQAWLTDDLAGGALPFFALHPMTDRQCEMRFDPGSLPASVPLGGGLWSVEGDVIIQPEEPGPQTLVEWLADDEGDRLADDQGDRLIIG